MNNDLKKIIEFTLDENSFYRNLVLNTERKIDSFPLLSRDVLQLHCKEIVSDSYKQRINELFITQSSGSLGIPITVYWSQSDYLISMRTLWERRRVYYGITPLSKKVQFTMTTNLQSERLQYKFDKKCTVLSFESSSLNSKTNILGAWKLIEQFQPEWMYIQPSILHQLIENAICHNIKVPKSIRYIECIGELLYDDLRISAMKFFYDVKIASMYGSEEMNGIGIECPYHRMHVISKNVYVEVARNGVCYEYGEGDVIVTHLKNFAQPLVRYMQGDRINLELPVKCECGYEDKIISKIRGRIRESTLIDNDGVEINNFILCDCIRIINQKYSDVIKKYKFEFYKSKCMLLAILYTDSDDPIMISRIKEFIVSYLYNKNIKSIHFAFEFNAYDRYEAITNKHRIFEVIE